MRGHSFLPALFDGAPTVIDCGANHGEFTSELVDRYSARVTAVEPNPALIADVQRSGASEVRAAAIAEAPGTVWLTVDENDEASTTLGTIDSSSGRRVEVEAVALSALLDQLALDHIDLVKLDVEGAEIVAICGVHTNRLATIDQLTVEFHDAQGWTPTSEIRRVRNSLRRAGFLPIRMSVKHWGDTLFVRRSRLTTLEQWRVCWIERPLEFARRARDRRSNRRPS